MGIFLKYGLFSPCTLTKYGHVTWPKLQISKIFNQFVPILYIYVSVNSKPDQPPPGQNPQAIVLMGEFPTPRGKKEFKTPTPRPIKMN